MDSVNGSINVNLHYYLYTPLISSDVRSLNVELGRLQGEADNLIGVLVSLLKVMVLSFVYIFIQPLIIMYVISRNPADADLISLFRSLLSNEIFFLSTLILLPLGVTLHCIGMDSILNLYVSLRSIAADESPEGVPLYPLGGNREDDRESILSDDFYTPPSSSDNSLCGDNLDEDRKNDHVDVPKPTQVGATASGLGVESPLTYSYSDIGRESLRNLLSPILFGSESLGRPIDIFPKHFTEQMIADAKMVLVEFLKKMDEASWNFSEEEAFSFVDWFKDILSRENGIEELRNCMDQFFEDIAIDLEGLEYPEEDPFALFSTANFTKAMDDEDRKVVEEIIGTIANTYPAMLLFYAAKFYRLGNSLDGRITSLEFVAQIFNNDKTLEEMTSIRNSSTKYAVVLKALGGPLEEFIESLDVDSPHFSGFIRVMSLDRDSVIKILYSEEPGKAGKFIDYCFDAHGINVV